MRGRGRRTQRGFGGFMMLMLFVSAAATAGLFAFHRSDTVQAKNDRLTGDALAAAKAALIGYALNRGGNSGPARPGELPCPDTDGDGFAETSCTSAASLLGRIPWKTLNIPQPVDATGETLWYALAAPFRQLTAAPGPTQRINSDTRGNITVRAADGSTVLTNQAMAVIFAPGAAIGDQNRGGSALGTVTCTLSGVNLTRTRDQCPSNYLDLTGSMSNATSATGPFIAGAISGSFNDRLVYLEAAEVIPLVEMRVSKELQGLLTEYRVKSICQCYPWADTWPYSGGIADVSQNRGRFPTEPVPELWGSGAIPSLPDWLGDNNWHNLFWYSVSRQASADPTGCRTCSTNPTLTVGSVKVAALFFTPGTPLDGLARVPPISVGTSLSSAQRARADNLSLYLQDSQNNDGAVSGCPDTGEIGANAGSGSLTGNTSCDQYVTPTATRRDRDRVHMLGVASAAICATNGQALAAAAPCGSAWSVTNPACIAAMPNLDACSCANAARVLARPPCTNVTNPSECQAALAELASCTP
jgi:hypothetical protein